MSSMLLVPRQFANGSLNKKQHGGKENGAKKWGQALLACGYCRFRSLFKGDRPFVGGVYVVLGAEHQQTLKNRRR